jgi:hypothetical protein
MTAPHTTAPRGKAKGMTAGDMTARDGILTPEQVRVRHR